MKSIGKYKDITIILNYLLLCNIMNLAEKAFTELFPEKIITKRLSVNYSRKFKPYNANVKYTQQYIAFSLSKDWKEVSEEIQVGLIQNLLLRIFKEKKKTLNTGLYNDFLKNLPKYSIPTNIDLLLEVSFERINKKYFFSYMDKPNLVWGQEAFRKLGSYEYASNTITISTVLMGEGVLLDYVMYHEMLHKDLKFESKNGRNYHHTPEFRKREKQFEESDMEKKLGLFLRKKRLRRSFRFF